MSEDVRTHDTWSFPLTVRFHPPQVRLADYKTAEQHKRDNEGAATPNVFAIKRRDSDNDLNGSPRSGSNNGDKVRKHLSIPRYHTPDVR
eukprot:5661620-Pyramimonas_sp.AAC.1